MFLGFRNDYGIVESLQPLGVKDIEIRAVGLFIWLTKLSKFFLENLEC